MPLPTLTHLQFSILQSLLNGEKAGREIRDELRKAGEKKSGPAFYQLMSRLEESKFVGGRYDEKVIEGQMIRERRYKILGNGLKAHAHTAQFYFEAANAAKRGGLEYV
jgi:DNA-binding PadR family transcriptional regulator